ncbi:hypothetical protein E4U25_006791 [Claviceps purpurea]|nr:hypothetical protein E4U25_006791 [Claviceps purpurea]
MAAAGITGSGGSKNATYTRHKGTRGMIDIPEGKNDDQASVNPRAETGHHDLVKSRPRSRGGGSGGCDVDVATPAIGATSTETENQSETTTVTGSATVTTSVTTVSPMTNLPGQGFADGKIAVRNAPRHPPSTSLKTSIFSQSLDGHESAIESTALAAKNSAIGNRIPTTVAVTIALATVAGVALFAAAVFLWMLCRRRRSGHLISRKAKSGISAPSVPIALKVLPRPCTYQSSASPAIPAPIAEIDRSIQSAPTFATNTAAPECLVGPASSSVLSFKDDRDGGGPWWKIYGGLGQETTSVGSNIVKAPSQQPSIPPPMLMERKFHPSINGSTVSKASVTSMPKSHRGHVRGRHTPLVARNLDANWQLPISPITSVRPPRQDDITGVTTSSASLIPNTTYKYSSPTSPPSTSGKRSIREPVLENPGPPPDGPLSLPPPKTHPINSSLPPTKLRRDILCPEEVGMAISGPSSSSIAVEKPYYQVWCDAYRWQPPPTRKENMFSEEWI